MGKEYNSTHYRSEKESVGEEVGSGHGQIMAMGLVGKIKNKGKSLKGPQQGSNMIHPCVKTTVLDDIRDQIGEGKSRRGEGNEELLPEFR